MKNFWKSVYLVNDSITIKDTSQKKITNKVDIYIVLLININRLIK